MITPGPTPEYGVPMMVTRRYAATPGGKERVTARWGPHQATTLCLSGCTSLENHWRAASLLASKHNLRGKWLIAPRNSHTWGWIHIDTGRTVSVHPNECGLEG